MCLSVSSSNFLSSINERPTAQTDDSQCYIFQKTKMRLILSGFCRHPFTPLRASPPGHSNFLSHNTMSRKMRQKKARITCILISNTFVLAPFVNSVRRIPSVPCSCVQYPQFMVPRPRQNCSIRQLQLQQS